jgi:ribosomal protein S18 acetylase RimI-like enzyme
VHKNWRRCHRNGNVDDLRIPSSAALASFYRENVLQLATLRFESRTRHASANILFMSDEATEREDMHTYDPRNMIFSAKCKADFEVAAKLRATAFYEDLEARQALPFPPRFVATFRREFAQRESRALEERTRLPSGASSRCICLMSMLNGHRSIGCLDVSLRSGPCASPVNGVCVGEEEDFVYIDNVAVDTASRRKGSASALLEASSDIGISWGACFIYTHVHAQNLAARHLYHSYGFQAPDGVTMLDELSPAKKSQWASPRLMGLMLLRAPLPLKLNFSKIRVDKQCVCGARFEDCSACVCNFATGSRPVSSFKH